MVGLELNINGKIITAGLKNGVVLIIATKLTNEFVDTINLDFTGLNTSEKGYEEMIDWYKSNLKIGDELMIKVKEIDMSSTPIEIRRKSQDLENERKLKTYHSLKKELKSKGLI